MTTDSYRDRYFADCRQPDGTLDFSKRTDPLPHLEGCDLRGANFTGHEADFATLLLSGADLRGAVGLPAAPAVKDLDAKILARLDSGKGRLDMGYYQLCATTHCRAGWAIRLAGPAGSALERRYNPSVAGALIYAASDPDNPVPDFYTTEGEAMKDMRARAARSQVQPK